MIGLIGTILSNIVLMSDGIKKAKEDNDSINIAKKFNNPTYTDARGNHRLVATRQKVYEYINANGDLQIDDMKTGQVIQIIKRNPEPEIDWNDTFFGREDANIKNRKIAIQNNECYYNCLDYNNAAERRRTIDNIAVRFLDNAMIFTKYGNLFIGYNKSWTDKNGKLYVRKEDSYDIVRGLYNFYCKAVEYNVQILNNGKTEEYYLINSIENSRHNENEVDDILENHKNIIITQQLSFEEYVNKYINYISDDNSIDKEHIFPNSFVCKVTMPDQAMKKKTWETVMYPFNYKKVCEEEIKEIIVNEWKSYSETENVKSNLYKTFTDYVKAEKERRNA